MSDENEYKLTEVIAPFVRAFIVICVIITILFIAYKGLLFLTLGA